jgi:hypothetical protein
MKRIIMHWGGIVQYVARRNDTRVVIKFSLLSFIHSFIELIKSSRSYLRKPLFSAIWYSQCMYYIDITNVITDRNATSKSKVWGQLIQTENIN